jgi:ankyrin repeat protein
MNHSKRTVFFIATICLIAHLQGAAQCSWHVEGLLVALGYPAKSIERRIRNYGMNQFGLEAQLLADMLEERDLLTRAENKQEVPLEFFLLKGARENLSSDNFSEKEHWVDAANFFANPLAVESYLCMIQKDEDKNKEGKKEIAGRLLHKAIHEDAPIATAQLLLDRGADSNHSDIFGSTALMKAAEHNRADLVELLLSYGADFTKTNSQGRTPFYIALLYGNTAMAESFLKRGADLDRFGKPEDSALYIVVEKSLVDPEHYEPITRFLINRGANVNYAHNGTSLLMLTARDDNPYMAQLLLEHGADINMIPEELSPLQVAFINEKHDMLQLLLDSGAQPHLANQEGETLVHAAARQGRVEDIQLLLRAGATPNTKDARGWTPLADAAARGYAAIVAELLEHGGWNSLYHPVDGKLPKELAKENGHLTVFEMLDGYY